ncbi:putative CUE domain protein [Aspergillus lucknowensis]|uniref:Fe2OG dioxygenase domain-containing protein n=1 Tax=Aspergillus lucknowensis TaxID=176173 RepID=A0ABR4M5M6_9EURO
MDRYLSRKRPRSRSRSRSCSPPANPNRAPVPVGASDDDDASTDIKLAQLVSLFVDTPQDTLLDILVSCGGSVETAITTLTTEQKKQRSLGNAKRTRTTATATAASSASAIQTSLASHVLAPGGINKDGDSNPAPKRRNPVQKGKTLYLYSPEDVATHTSCTIIHNFLPAEQANALLLELLDESRHFSRYQLQIFERTVESPHSTCVYVSTPEEQAERLNDYSYGGSYHTNIRQATPHLRAISAQVQRAVNAEIQKRIRDVYPGGKKLMYQSPREWIPNAAFVNCYDGPAESVGYHTDHLTYLGPRAVIGSLSLGVQREFRVRRIVADEAESGEENANANAEARAHIQGQISIALPHNSLLVMHAETQEEWKHSIAPAQTISPHPLSGNRRINVTYRWYRDSLHPRNIPRCRCNAHAVLKCVQRKRDTRGRYMWVCYMGSKPGKKGCGFFQWAEFDDDGEPLWKTAQVKNEEDEKAPELTNFAG